MRTLISCILLSCLTLRARSGPEIRFGPIPSWLISIHTDLNRPPSAEEISNGYFYELQEQQTNIPLHTEFFHVIRHIVNSSGIQDASELSVTFSPQYQQVVFHRIRIIRNGAVIDQLRPERIQLAREEPDAGDFEYNGLRRAFITLTDIREGDRLDIAWSVIGFNPVFGGKYSAQQSFTRGTAVCNYFRAIITSADRPLRFIAYNGAAPPETLLAGSRLIYRWNNPVLKEDDRDGEGENIPFAGITEYKDWREVADWGLNTFNRYQYPLPASLLEKIAAWRKAASGNPDRFANLATRFVQNEIRYLGLEMGANSHRPHSPSEVFGDRYGDCKDKSLLLTCILRHVGIPAYASLVNTAEGKTLARCAPSPGLFNHVIVAVQRPGGKWLYVDPTLAGQRGEFSGLYLPDYGYTLLLRDGEDSLRTVLPSQTDAYTILEELDARYEDTSRFSVTTIFAGGAADKIRRSFDDNSRKDIEEGYLKYYASWLPGIETASPLGYHDDSLNNLITVRELYAIPAIWTTDKDGKRALDFCVKMIQANLPDPSRIQSDAPLTLCYPLQIHYALQMRLPDNWDFGAGPLHIRNDAYQFDFTPQYGDREMTLHYSLVTFADHINAADARQYREDYKNIDDRVSFTLYKDNSSPDLAPSLDQTAAPDRAGDLAVGHLFRPCWPAIWLSFFYALLFSRLFVRLNGRSAEKRFFPLAGKRPLTGWVLVLGICIGMGFTMDAYELFRANYYNTDNWNAWTAAGGWEMQWLYLGQLAIQLNFLAGAGAILYWFVKRRDIFPRMFIGFAAVVLIGRLALIGMYHIVPIPVALGAYRSDLPWAFVRTSVYAAFWVTYVLRSGRVRDTFLERFRPGL